MKKIASILLIIFLSCKAIVSFRKIGGSHYSSRNELKFFEIVGKMKKFFSVTGVIKAGKVIVSSIKVNLIKYVRYGWKAYFEPNFFNKQGLPASFFNRIN